MSFHNSTSSIWKSSLLILTVGIILFSTPSVSIADSLMLDKNSNRVSLFGKLEKLVDPSKELTIEDVSSQELKLIPVLLPGDIPIMPIGFAFRFNVRRTQIKTGCLV